MIVEGTGRISSSMRAKLTVGPEVFQQVKRHGELRASCFKNGHERNLEMENGGVEFPGNQWSLRSALIKWERPASV